MTARSFGTKFVINLSWGGFYNYDSVFLQVITNDKFKAAEHRVLANCAGPRISLACFFTTHFEKSNKIFGPIKQLLSEDEPPLYRETSVKEYIDSYYSTGLLGDSSLARLRM